MRRLGLVVLLLAAAAAGVAVWTVRTEPGVVPALRYPLRYEAIVRTHAGTTTSPPTLLAAVIYTESKFDADARSGAGAVGLMQLLPETAKGIALRTGGHRFVVADLYDPEINVRYGSWYLRQPPRPLRRRPTALAAYHAGQGNVDEWRREGVGIQFPETRDYVDKVLEAQRVYADAYADELGRGLRRLGAPPTRGGPPAEPSRRCPAHPPGP